MHSCFSVRTTVLPSKCCCFFNDAPCVNNVIQLVISKATDKDSFEYKIFTQRLTPHCISDRLLEQIWPEINEKHLDLSPKSLKNVDKAILKDLGKIHKCKEKD